MSTTLLLILFILTTLAHFSHAKPLCTPSSCGVIRNISYPFRLQGDPYHCGHLMLTCHHNLTSISLNSRKFYVKAIDYQNSTIRVADPFPNNDNICSFPISSFPMSSFYYYLTDDSDYDYTIPTYSTYPYDYKATFINLMSCPNPLKNSSLYTNISTNCSIMNDRYSYIKFGRMNASEVPHLCRLDLIAMTSWQFHDLKNVSLSEFHQSLLYGIVLNFCNDCRPWPDPFWWVLLLPATLLILGILCCAISPPIFTLFGIAALSMGLYQTLLLFDVIFIQSGDGWSSAQIGIVSVIGVVCAVICPPIFILIGIAALSMGLLQFFALYYDILMIPPSFGFPFAAGDMESVIGALLVYIYALLTYYSLCPILSD